MPSIITKNILSGLGRNNKKGNCFLLLDDDKNCIGVVITCCALLWLDGVIIWWGESADSCRTWWLMMWNQQETGGLHTTIPLFLKKTILYSSDGSFVWNSTNFPSWIEKNELLIQMNSRKKKTRFYILYFSHFWGLTRVSWRPHVTIRSVSFVRYISVRHV